MQPLIDFLLQLVRKKWTGKIVLNFHNGVIKKATEEKEVKF